MVTVFQLIDQQCYWVQIVRCTAYETQLASKLYNSVFLYTFDPTLTVHSPIFSSQAFFGEDLWSQLTRSRARGPSPSLGRGQGRGGSGGSDSAARAPAADARGTPGHPARNSITRTRDRDYRGRHGRSRADGARTVYPSTSLSRILLLVRGALALFQSDNFSV